MIDHMAEGRFIFGISPGGLLSDAEVLGNLDKDRRAMFLESINKILEIWAGEPPYDLKGDFWEISTKRTLMPEFGQGFIAKPFQKPHPPIVVTAVTPFSSGVTEAAKRGWDPVSANFLQPKWVKTHWPRYVKGCEEVADRRILPDGESPNRSPSPKNRMWPSVMRQGRMGRITSTTNRFSPS